MFRALLRKKNKPLGTGLTWVPSMPSDLVWTCAVPPRSIIPRSFSASASWRCDVVLESDVCLTYCVPLADSLCSFVRVQHVLFICLFWTGGWGLLVSINEGECARMTALENNLFKKQQGFLRGSSSKEENSVNQSSNWSMDFFVLFFSFFVN